MLMEPIILVFIKLMGTTISGHWDLRDTGTLRDYDTLVWSLWVAVTAKLQIIKGCPYVHISNSTTPIVLILVSGDS